MILFFTIGICSPRAGTWTLQWPGCHKLQFLQLREGWFSHKVSSSSWLFRLMNQVQVSKTDRGNGSPTLSALGFKEIAQILTFEERPRHTHTSCLNFAL